MMSLFNLEKTEADNLTAPYEYNKEAMRWLDAIKGRYDRFKKRRTVNKAEKVIKKQGKKKRALIFDYTNKAGETKRRFVDPYEIKDGYLWAAEHGTGKIKRFFMDKIKHPKPGSESFTPRWEVKTASVLRNKYLLRAAEGLIGAGVGGGLAYGESSGDSNENRLVRAAGGAALGAALAVGLSSINRAGKGRIAVQRGWDKNRSFKYQPSSFGKGEKPVHRIFEGQDDMVIWRDVPALRPETTMPAARKELKYLQAKGLEKYIEKYVRADVDRAILRVHEPEVIQEASRAIRGFNRNPKVREAFLEGFYLGKRPPTKMVEENIAYLAGRNRAGKIVGQNKSVQKLFEGKKDQLSDEVRTSIFGEGNNMELIDRIALSQASARDALNRSIIKNFYDKPIKERVKRVVDPKLFGQL